MKFLFVLVLIVLVSSFNNGCTQKQYPHRKHMDTNGDGVVSHREYKKAKHRSHHMDTNRDGYVTRHEFPGPDRRFDRLDRNNDGVLTRGELP